MTTENKLNIMFSNIGDNRLDGNFCLNFNKQGDDVIKEQTKCICDYMYIGYDVIALEEVCLNSILSMNTGKIILEIENALKEKKYHLYITPLKRHNEYYGTTLYKVNVILTNTEKLEFNVEYHKNFFNTNCLIGRIPILFKDNINEKEKSIFIKSNRNYQNKFVRKIDINDNIYTEIENAFIVRFNWTYMDVDNDICSTLFHGQPSLYKIKSNKKNLLIYNIHNKEIFITEKPQQIADLGPILINEKDYYNKDINKDITKNNLKYEIFKNIGEINNVDKQTVRFKSNAELLS
jgi:hypothetical protein